MGAARRSACLLGDNNVTLCKTRRKDTTTRKRGRLSISKVLYHPRRKSHKILSPKRAVLRTKFRERSSEPNVHVSLERSPVMRRKTRNIALTLFFSSPAVLNTHPSSYLFLYWERSFVCIDKEKYPDLFLQIQLHG